MQAVPKTFRQWEVVLLHARASQVLLQQVNPAINVWNIFKRSRCERELVLYVVADGVGPLLTWWG